MMRIVYLTHSLVSCWNHGNAHFLRGLLRELTALGHDVLVYEPEHGWSRENLVRDHGQEAIERFGDRFPGRDIRLYGVSPDVDRMLDGADLVIVHEWTDPRLIAAIGNVRARGGRFRLLFHDTHHRAISDSQAMRGLDLSGYDGVLAFGAALAKVYRRMGWGERAYVFHEAADTALFHPIEHSGGRRGTVWIGNWGDGERSAEIAAFLLRPARAAESPLDIYGVRYPEAALGELAKYGARYHGWLANSDVPHVFSRHALTVHVPRRFYRTDLPGIPTIRVFEALACGIPLLSAPWDDCEGLFQAGEDFLIASSEAEMARCMRDVANDAGLANALARSGLRRIGERHTCAHRAAELMRICAKLQVPMRGAA